MNYSQVLKGAQYMNIATELGSKLTRARNSTTPSKSRTRSITSRGIPTATLPEVRTSEKAEDMLRFDLDNELQTIANYRERVRQADALGEFALCEVLRQILVQEQEHAIDLATALGIDVPPIPEL